MKVLTIDIGGTNVKFLVNGRKEARKFPSGPTLTPHDMVERVKEMTQDWSYDVVSIGYPGVVTNGRPAVAPHNLGPGWVKFDFERAFGCPVRMMNDAAMQALGSYEGGLLLFLGLGTGLGSALVVGGTVIPMELGHLSYKNGTYEDYVGRKGLERLGKKKWAANIKFGVNRLIQALHPDDVVLGGGNVKKLKKIPPGCRAGDNAYAFLGGLRMWNEPARDRKKAESTHQLANGRLRQKEEKHGDRPNGAS